MRSERNLRKTARDPRRGPATKEREMRARDRRRSSDGQGGGGWRAGANAGGPAPTRCGIGMLFDSALSLAPFRAFLSHTARWSRKFPRHADVFATMFAPCTRACVRAQNVSSRQLADRETRSPRPTDPRSDQKSAESGEPVLSRRSGSLT